MNWITLTWLDMQVFLFISGIGILLLAMQQLERNLNRLGSERLQQSIKAFTGTPVHGLILGITATAILQSSSIVGLMTMALVASGVIRFRCAIGVILGSNLGTTFTGWLVTFIGFKLNLTEFYLPILGLGALGTVFFGKATRQRNYSRLMFAFGLLLMGLVVMKDSIAFVIDLVDITMLQDLPLIIYFIFGLVLTAIIQSSSANMVITLSAMHAGIVDLPAAAAWIIGADLGTTSTMLIGSVKGTVVKKQVAAVHFIFNFITDVAALLMLPLLLILVTEIFSINDPLIGLVAIHSSFNLVGILVFMPFTGALETLITRWIKAEPEEKMSVELLPEEVPELALEAIEKDTAAILVNTLRLNAMRLDLDIDGAEQFTRLPGDLKDEIYSSLKTRENILTNFILDFQRNPLDEVSAGRLPQLLVCIRDSLYAAKAIKDIDEDISRLRARSAQDILSMLDELTDAMESLYHNILVSIGKGEEFNITMLSELSRDAEEIHSSCNSYIYELIDNNALHRETASTLLNINREVLFSNQSLVNALQHFMLPGEQARTVSEILNLRLP